jgi:TPR repeat protein
MPLVCPHCRSADLRPASAQHADTWVQRKLSQAYRCRACGRRSWRLEPAIVALVLAGALVVVTPIGFLSLHFLRQAPEASQPVAEDPLASLARRAGQGEVAAQIELGRRHEDGDGTRVDTAEASRWYARAAEAGGRGVVQDYRSALEWLARAAEQNHPKAQRRLGQMYADGRGTPVDKVQAYVWLSLAAASGEDEAARQRDQVLMHLPDEQITQAQDQARALHARLSSAARMEQERAQPKDVQTLPAKASAPAAPTVQ